MEHTDYHCHILPGIDDGAQTLDESVLLVGALVKWGYTKAVCTPHIVPRFRNNPDTIKQAYDALCPRLEEEGIKIELEYSAEYRLIPDTWNEVLAKGWLMPFEGNHILIELPLHNPGQLGSLKPLEEIARLMDMGYAPILAHPERYAYLSDEQLEEIYETGTKFQIDHTSLAGVYDRASEERAALLVEKGMDSEFYGTDLHDETYVRYLDEYFRKIKNLF